MYSSTYPTQPYPGYPSASYPQQSYPSYGDPRNNSVQVQPHTTSRLFASGGLSFEITLADASVGAGRHHIEIRADGYEPMAFDTTVTAGQVVPYRGTLQQR